MTNRDLDPSTDDRLFGSASAASASPEARPAPTRKTRRTVFLLHGILLNRWFLWPLARYLTARGHHVVNLSYPSTKRNIEDHASWLFSQLDQHRPADPRIEWRADFVTHSLGGLVVRRLLYAHSVPEAGRFLQIVPPNRGSSVVRELRGGRLYDALYGRRSGRQLGDDSESLETLLGPRPPVEMGILLGDAPPAPVRSGNLAGGGDGSVSWEESQFDDRVPTLTIPHPHTLILFKHETWRIVDQFLVDGVNGAWSRQD